MHIDQEELVHQIALNEIKGVGHHLLKHLMNKYKTAQEVFKANKKDLLLIPGIHLNIVGTILKKSTLPKAEKVMRESQKHGVEVFSYFGGIYPTLLKEISTPPMILYFKGKHVFEESNKRYVAIVGTRNPTSYGKEFLNQLIPAMKQSNIVLVSGLAYGIDIYVHKLALEHEIPTLGVIGSGIKAIYPSIHTKIAEQMLASGGLLTEHTIYTKPCAYFFPARNRIIAGICKAVLVIEAGKQSGSLITAKLANEYNREVFALPGNVNSAYSEGCNNLIKNHEANLLTDLEDIAYIMNWNLEKNIAQKKRKPSFLEATHYTKSEKVVLNTVYTAPQHSIHRDLLEATAEVNPEELPLILLNLEMKGAIKCQPGNYLKWIAL